MMRNDEKQKFHYPDQTGLGGKTRLKGSQKTLSALKESIYEFCGAFFWPFCFSPSPTVFLLSAS